MRFKRNVRQFDWERKGPPQLVSCRVRMNECWRIHALFVLAKNACGGVSFLRERVSLGTCQSYQGSRVQYVRQRIRSKNVEFDVRTFSLFFAPVLSFIKKITKNSWKRDEGNARTSTRTVALVTTLTATRSSFDSCYSAGDVNSSDEHTVHVWI